MTRRSVKLAWIANKRVRRACLKNRRLGLVKKVNQLTILCGIEACLIIYNPEEIEPLVWPSHAEVHRQLGKFYSMPELERKKKMMNLETYLKEKATKFQEQLVKQQRKNKEVEMGRLMYQIDQGKGLDEFDLDELCGETWLVEGKMKEIRKRIEFFQQVPFSSASLAHGDLPLPPEGPADHDLTAQIGDANAELGGSGRIIAESLLWDQWFNDMMNHELKFGAITSSIGSDMGLEYYHPFAGTAADDLGLPRPSFGGSSSVAGDLGLPTPSFGDSSSVAGDLGLPRISYGGSSSAAVCPTLPPYGNFSGPNIDTELPNGSVGGNNFGPFDSDMGPGLHPFGHEGSSSTGSELEGLPFGDFRRLQ